MEHDNLTIGHSYTFYLETIESINERKEKEKILEKEKKEKERIEKELYEKKKVEDLRKNEERKKIAEKENIKWNMTVGAKKGALWGGILGFLSGFVSCFNNISEHGNGNWHFFSFTILGIIIGVIIGIIIGANTPNRTFDSF